MAEQSEQKEEARGVWRVIAAVAGGAVLIMGAWGAWVLHWAACAGHEVPGTFGDSFAPIVGLMTAGALGAAIASVFMQRRELELQRQEMREAREQFTKQAVALDDANKLAKRANELTHSAQVLEVSRQLAEVDSLAIRTLMAAETVGRSSSPAPIADLFFMNDAACARFWFELVQKPASERPGHTQDAHLLALAERRSQLEATLKALRESPE